MSLPLFLASLALASASEEESPEEIWEKKFAVIDGMREHLRIPLLTPRERMAVMLGMLPPIPQFFVLSAGEIRTPCPRRNERLLPMEVGSYKTHNCVKVYQIVQRKKDKVWIWRYLTQVPTLYPGGHGGYSMALFKGYELSDLLHVPFISGHPIQGHPVMPVGLKSLTGIDLEKNP